MPFSASIRLAQSSVSLSGITSARDLPCQVSRRSHIYRQSSGIDARPPDSHDFCPFYVLNQMQTSASTPLDDGVRFPGIILVVWAGILLTRSAVTLVRPVLRFLIAQSARSVVQHQMRQTRQMQIGVGCLPKSAPESFPCWRQERVAI